MKLFYITYIVVRSFLRYCLFVLLLAIIFFEAEAQKVNLDSLYRLISSNDDTTRAGALLAIGEELYLSQPDTAYAIWQEALKAAENSLENFGNISLDNEMKRRLLVIKADALNNIGVLLKQRGNMDEAIAHYQSSLKIREEIGDKLGEAESYYNIGFLYKLTGNIAKASEYFNKSLFIREQAGNKKGISGSLNNLGSLYEHQGDISKAIEYYQRSLAVSEEIDDKAGIANSLNNIGYVYQNQSDITKAIEYYLRSLKVREQTNDRKGMSYTLNNIGYTYFMQDEFEKALKFYDKSLKIKEELNDPRGIAISLNNIGKIYRAQKFHTRALECFNRSLVISEEVDDKAIKAASLNNIGMIYEDQKELAKALQKYRRSLELRKDIDDKHGITNSLNRIGHIYYDLGVNDSARVYSEKSLQMAKQLGFPEEIRNAAQLLADVYKSSGNYRAALQYFEMYLHMKDSVQNEDRRKDTERIKFRYEWNKRESEIRLEQEIQATVATSERKKQLTVTWSVIGGLILVLAFSIYMWKAYRQKKSANKALEKANTEITEQKSKVEEKNRDITHSIEYASRIQQAILPPEAHFKELLPDAFVLFKQRDIIGGDFYFVAQIEEHTILAVADCTGHGVPGALMSMLGKDMLNEIILERKITSPSHILGELDRKIISALNPTDDVDIKDGMDISLVSFRKDNGKIELQFAGANNNMWIIRKKSKESMQIVFADNKPIGEYADKEPFINNVVELNSGDLFYLFSDGYSDQLGGPKDRKFKSQAFQRLLLTNSEKPLQEQKEIVNNTIDEWMVGYQQTDDICVVGVRV